MTKYEKQGIEILYARKNAKKSQIEVCDETDICQATYINIEKGARDLKLEVFKKLVKSCQISDEQILKIVKDI